MENATSAHAIRYVTLFLGNRFRTHIHIIILLKNNSLDRVSGLIFLKFKNIIRYDIGGNKKVIQVKALRFKYQACSSLSFFCASLISSLPSN